jgi:four helix bundle protein
MSPPLFDHEKLRVYQHAIKFTSWLEDILTLLPKALSVHDQLDRASTSIPLNIAEGNGKFTAPDRCRFFDTARGSALECAACLDVAVARKQLASEQVLEGKTLLSDIVSMLVGLIKNNSDTRVYEEPALYCATQL